MVGFYEIDDLLRHVVLLCDLQPIFHVIDDDAGAFIERQAGVRIHPGAWFGEKSGVHHLPNIMIQRTGAD